MISIKSFLLIDLISSPAWFTIDKEKSYVTLSSGSHKRILELFLTAARDILDVNRHLKLVLNYYEI